MASRWLTVRWEALIPALEVAGDDEAQIAQLCQDELSLWRARPSMNELSSLRVPLSATRSHLKDVLKNKLTERNTWLNPRRQEREHLSLKYLNFSEEEWAAMNAPSSATLQGRLEDQQFFRDPDGLVALAVKLLTSERWDDCVVGLAVVTGRRLAEVLKTGVLYPNTRYTVTFAGQLKRRDKTLDPYEIPTLCEAALVLDAWQRLRQMQDCSQLTVEQISLEYSAPVRAAARHWFGDRVPVRTGHDDLYTHLFRTIYGRIAVLYYCPPKVRDLHYLSHVYGHYWVLSAETEEKRRHYLTTLHYSDYQIADATGNIDGRQGIRLAEPGVMVLEVFRPRTATEETTDDASPEEEEAMPMSETTKTGYSLIKVRKETRILFDQEAKRLEARGLDEATVELLERSRSYQQLLDALAPLGAALGIAADAPLEIVTALQQGAKPVPAGKAKSGKKAAEQRELEALVAGLRQTGTKEPVVYLRGLVERDAHFRAGLAKRHANVDYQALTLAQLSGIKTEEAANERFRRGVNAILAHNAATSEPLQRWFINAGSLRDLVGGRHPAAKAYLESRAEEIAAHHEKYGITQLFNRKPVDIKTMVKVEGQSGVVTKEESEVKQEGEG